MYCICLDVWLNSYNIDCGFEIFSKTAIHIVTYHNCMNHIICHSHKNLDLNMVNRNENMKIFQKFVHIPNTIIFLALPKCLHIWDPSTWNFHISHFFTCKAVSYLKLKFCFLPFLFTASSRKCSKSCC